MQQERVEKYVSVSVKGLDAGRYEHIRAKHPRAYELWPKEDDLELWRLYENGTTIDDLARIFQRQPSAIKSRLRKIQNESELAEFSTAAGTIPSAVLPSNMPDSSVPFTGLKPLRVELQFNWKPILRDGSTQYNFPDSISPFMREDYRHPAVYRWTVYSIGSDVLKAIYIGTTKQLCPDRIDGYLHPRNSKTNLRLHRKFMEDIENQHLVVLDVLQVCSVGGNLLDVNDFDMSKRSSRLFFENLLITYYRRTGVQILNL